MMPFHRKDRGEYYVEYDIDSQCYGVFHTEADGFCYALYSSEYEAHERVNQLNEMTTLKNVELLVE